jgi:hypothetical protein
LVRKGKGGKQRLLFLNDRLWEDMRRYYEKMGGGADEPVFCALTNNQHTANSPTRALSQSALVDMIRHHANGHFLSDQAMYLYFMKKSAKNGHFSVLGNTFQG